MADKPSNPYGDLANLWANFQSALPSPTTPDVMDLSTSAIYASLLPSVHPPVIQDRWFKDVTIHLDGYTYERCRFDNCKLFTKQAAFVFRQCVISSDCGLYVEGPALKIAQLLMHILAVKVRITPLPAEQGLFPRQNPDGTFTLE